MKINIKKLLRKFEDGQTSEEEEQFLADFFASQSDIPQEWQRYQLLFRSFCTDAYDLELGDIDVLMPGRSTWYHTTRVYWALAACVALLVLAWLLPRTAENDLTKPRQILTEYAPRVQVAGSRTVQGQTETGEEYLPDPVVASENGVIPHQYEASQDFSALSGTVQEKSVVDNYEEQKSGVSQLADILNQIFPEADNIELIRKGQNYILKTSMSNGMNRFYFFNQEDNQIYIINTLNL